MSRYSEGDYDPQYANEYELRAANLKRALAGRRGQKALRELRDALFALPDRRLISGAMCTVNPQRRAEQIPERHRPSRDYAWDHPRQDFLNEIGEGPGGVCAIGAYLWHRRVKAGMDPIEAFDSLPTLYGSEDDDNLWETAQIAQRDLGIVADLAWDLAFRNDETFASCTPEQRWTKYVEWLDQQLGDSVTA